MTADAVAIPLIEAPGGPADLARMHPERARRLVRATLPVPLLRLGDLWARRYLARSDSPYAAETLAVADRLAMPGVLALNLCFELGCTTACAPLGGSMRLLRTLDWPFPLGGEVVVARHAAAGGWYNITWPGFTGVLTGMAPGRFALAINQPPMRWTFRRFGLSLPVDWLVNRVRAARTSAMPPVHLSRLAFEQCPAYADAKRLLTTTPLCVPATYILTGTTPDEGCVIERTETEAVVHDGPVCVTNHWLNDRFRGGMRFVRNSHKRLAAMRDAMAHARGDFDWLVPPVLVRLTRVAAELDAAAGTMAVRGWHDLLPVTDALQLRSAPPGRTYPDRSRRSTA